MATELLFDSFIISVRAVLPLFFMLLAGVMVKRFKILGDEELPKINNLVYSLFLPLLVFSGIYKSDLSNAIDACFILFTLTAVLLVFFAGLLFALLIEKSNAARGAIIQAIFRSNITIMGIPLVSGIYGGSNLETISVMIAFLAPLYNGLAVITLETLRSTRTSFTKILTGILKNPLIISGAAGVLFSLLDIRLPSVLEKFISEMAGVAAPLAIVILGASLKFFGIGGNRRNLIVCVAGRLAVVPGIVLAAAALLGFRDVEFVTLIAIFASPCAVSSFTMAQKMDSESELTGNSVAISSVLACFTMFFWILLYKELGIF